MEIFVHVDAIDVRLNFFIDRKIAGERFSRWKIFKINVKNNAGNNQVRKLNISRTIISFAVYISNNIIFHHCES